MDLLKALKRTILSAAAVLALGAAPAFATTDSCVLGDDCTDVLAHCTASVTAALTIIEDQAINFGNFGVLAGATAGGSVVTISNTGKRTLGTNTDTLVLLYGNSNSQPGYSGASSNSGDTGAGAAGYYTISNTGEGTGTQKVYVTFADQFGNLMDANHPGNIVEMALVGTPATYFSVNNFTVQANTTTGSSPASGYTATSLGNDEYGNYVTLSGHTAGIEVGATMTTIALAGGYPAGRYVGTFNIMVSY